MLNKVQLIGHLGADPETRTLQSGQTVCRLRIATNEVYKDKNGEKQERTEWHRVTTWGKLAEICGQYLTKGRLVYVEGRLKNDTYEQDGTTRYSYEIVAREMKMLGRGDGAAAGNQEPEPGVPEDEIPF